MAKYLKLFTNHTAYSAVLNQLDVPNVSFCNSEDEIHYNSYYSRYLTTIAKTNGTISFNIWRNLGTDCLTSISYSTDNGSTWTTTDNVDGKELNLLITINVSQGDKVLWKGVARLTGYYDEDEGDTIGSFFSSTCQFDVEGNVMSLLYDDDFLGKKTLLYVGQLCNLFYDYDNNSTTSVVNAKNLALPATIITNYCYYQMFSDCTTLITPPVLPAIRLADSCYSAMFAFCAHLITAPALPATTLATNCYCQMFYGCISLATAPELPATTLTTGCYWSMFSGCTILNEITCLATNISATNCTTNWVQNVAASGTFTKDASTSWNTGNSGVPSGWTIVSE